MFVRCIKARFGVPVDSVIEIPDGSEVASYWFVPCDAPSEQITFPPAA